MTDSKPELADEQMTYIMTVYRLHPSPGSDGERQIAKAIRYAYELGQLDGVKRCLKTSREILRSPA